MSLLPKKIQAGYTLMEVLVVVAIIGILAGSGLATYARFRERQMVEQAAMNFANELRQVQKRADAGEKPLLCTSQLLGYGVAVNDVANVTNISANCSGAPPPENYVLSNDAKFTGNLEVDFLTIGNGVNVIVPNTIISNITNTYQYRITVEAGGVITVEKIL